MNHVIENVEYAARSGVGTLTKNDLSIYNQVVEAYKNIGFIACSDCRYCMPCPSGVYISKVMRLMNEYYMGGKNPEIRTKALQELKPEYDASNCIACGKCEEKCPQELYIMRVMNEAKWVFAR